MSDFGINIGSRRSRNVITPTFSRDFITNATLNHGVGPNITFTRASSATFFTSTGILSTALSNFPRFEWGNFRTNLVPYSEDFSNWFVNQGTILTNQAISPNGTTTVDILSGSVIGGDGYVYRNLTLAPGTTGTFSCWMGSVNENFSTRIRVVNSDWNFIGNSNKVVNLTPTLQRESVNFTVSSDGFARLILGGSSTLSAGRQVSLWGAQVEYGPIATSYIPTTTSPATTGVPLGFLIEESRSNLIEYSQDINNAYWNKAQTTITTNVSTVPAPNNTLSADKLVESAVLNNHLLRVASPGVVLENVPYTFSIFAKPEERSVFRLSLREFINSGDYLFTATYNLLSGTVVATGGAFLSGSSIQNIGNGWYRCTVTGSPSAPNEPTARFPEIRMLQNDGVTFNYLGDGTSGFYIWGAQIEQGTYPTTHIITGGLSATRQADSAIVTPINSFYNPEQGTMLAEIIRPQVVKYSSFFGFNNGGGNEQYLLESGVADPTLHRFQVIDNGVSQAQIGNYTGSLTNTIYRLAGAYAIDNFGVSQNEISPSLDSKGNLPTVTQAVFSVTPSQTYIRKVTYWPTRLSNNRLRLITS